MKIDDLSFERSQEPFLHPGQSAEILASGKRIGFFGLLHPDVTEQLDIKAARPEIFLAEMDLDLLISLIPEEIRSSSLPRYPYMERDIAIIVDDSIPASEVIRDLKGFPSELIEDVSIFDLYKGPNIPEDKKSLAFSIRYRAKDRTLTDAEVDSLHKEIISYICNKTGGIIRG